MFIKLFHSICALYKPKQWQQNQLKTSAYCFDLHGKNASLLHSEGSHVQGDFLLLLPPLLKCFAPSTDLKNQLFIHSSIWESSGNPFQAATIRNSSSVMLPPHILLLSTPISMPASFIAGVPQRDKYLISRCLPNAAHLSLMPLCLQQWHSSHRYPEAQQQRTLQLSTIPLHGNGLEVREQIWVWMKPWKAPNTVSQGMFSSQISLLRGIFRNKGSRKGWNHSNRDCQKWLKQQLLIWASHHQFQAGLLLALAWASWDLEVYLRHPSF